MPTLTRNTPPRRLTDAERRDLLTDKLMSGEITPREWSLKVERLDRRRTFLGWALLVSVAGGFLASAIGIVGLAWLFIVLVTHVAGTVTGAL